MADINVCLTPQEALDVLHALEREIAKSRLVASEASVQRIRTLLDDRASSLESVFEKVAEALNATVRDY